MRPKTKDESKLRRQVREFHVAFGHPIGNGPHVPKNERIRLRLRLIAEEFFELLEACGHTPDDGADASIVGATMATVKNVAAAIISKTSAKAVDLPEVADALADLDYVIEGMRCEFGIDGGPVADEVHASNLRKLGPDGKVMRRFDGKVTKPEGWQPPDIAEVLRRQGWKG